MKLKATNYVSPIPTEGTFAEVFIEETDVLIRKNKKYMSITFEMYYFRNGERIVLDERNIAFYGMQGDKETSNKLAVISVPNEDYEFQVANVPIKVEVNNPEYDPREFINEFNPDYNQDDPESQLMIPVLNPTYNNVQFILIDNPSYTAQVAAIPQRVTVPFLQYLYTHEGQLPAEYEVVEWGYPNYQDSLQYFEGGDKSKLEIDIVNPFAREWLRNTLIMKNEKIGVQFNFED